MKTLTASIRNSTLLSAAFIFFAVPGANGHEEGAPFSDAIVDPLLVHHAHIENEQRINLFGLRGFGNEVGHNSSAFEGELEMGYSTHDFRYGWEMFVPIANLPSRDGSGRATGIGDIEVRPIKYALFQRPWFILSTASGIRLPTGSKSDGLGEGNTVLTQYPFADAAAGNWFVGVNLAGGTNVSGDSGSSVEYGTVLAYSFIRGTEGLDVAKVPRSQH